MYLYSVNLLFILKLGHKSANKRSDLNRKLVARLDKVLRLLAHTNTSRGSSNDDSSGRKGSTLRQKADELWNAEYNIAVVDNCVREKNYQANPIKTTYSTPQSCRTLPFLSPPTRKTEGSEINKDDTIVGPI